MPVYTASHPDNKTLGASIIPLTSVLLNNNARPVLEKAGMLDLEPDTWYPQQQYLDIFNELVHYEDLNINLVHVGTKIIEGAAYPPQVQTFEEAIMTVNDAYRLNNNDKHSGWVITRDGDRFLCASTTPFPQDFEYGVLYGIAKRFLPRNHGFSIEYQNMKMRTQPKKAMRPCVYVITLEKM